MKIKILIQHFIGCPNSPILIQRVKEAIKDLKDVDCQEILVDTNEKAKALKFRGSPTLLINGVDFENLPVPENPNLACRFYPNGLPTKEEILSKLNSII